MEDEDGGWRMERIKKASVPVDDDDHSRFLHQNRSRSSPDQFPEFAECPEFPDALLHLPSVFTMNANQT